MTREEIKQATSMRELAERYGLKVNRAGFASCPFHKGDREPSLKIYTDSYHCFGCEADGDVFSFVMKMENVDFKTAFQMLGGTYEKPSPSELVNRRLLRISQEKAARKRREELDERRRTFAELQRSQERIEVLQPFSDEWCEEMKKIESLKQKAGLYEE